MIHDTATIRTARDGLVRGLTYNQIADLLGVTKNVVAGIVHRHARDDAKSRPARTTSSKLSSRPDIREAVVASVEAGLHDAEIERRLTEGSKGLVSEIRKALAAEGVCVAQNRYSRPKAPTPIRPNPIAAIAPDAPPKPSAFMLRVVPTVSTRRQTRPQPRHFWTDPDIRRLRELILTEPSVRRIAEALGRPESTVAHKLAEMGITPVYKLSFLTRGAIDRLHREGQPIRRIAVRTGIPIPLIERHLANANVGKSGGSSP